MSRTSVNNAVSVWKKNMLLHLAAMICNVELDLVKTSITQYVNTLTALTLGMWSGMEVRFPHVAGVMV